MVRQGGAWSEGIRRNENSYIGSTGVTDWTLIAGGRCPGQPWRVAIAGFSVAEQEAFLLSDTDWAELQEQLPLEPLTLYGQGNGLLFKRIIDMDFSGCDAVLLIAHL